MNNLNLDKYLEIVNEEKNRRGLNNYVPLYPMLRIDNNKLYICIVITNEKDNVWDRNEKIKPEYWVLLDIKNKNIIEFNETSKKDYVEGNIIIKEVNNKQKEISEYTIKKTMQYKNYLIEDIKNEELPLQKKLSAILGKNIEIDGKQININDYLLSNFEEEIKSKVNELVRVLIQSKYGSITFYYDNLFDQIIEEYLLSNNINKDKIKYCIEIMNNYYDGVITIDNIFNI